MKHSWKSNLPIENIKEIIPVGGGDVNDAYKIKTKQGTYFLLVQKNQSADFYAAEISGLKDFEKAGVTAPKVIDNGVIDGDAYLMLSYLDEGRGGSQKDLAELVVKLHQYHQDSGKFGYHLSSDFGEVQFNNEWTDDWAEIFINRRMNMLKDVVVNNGAWSRSDIKTYESVRTVMKEALSKHKSEPSLLHGDLWGGNYMFLTDGTPALFDPAPLFGDREFDLGATKVFGGFTREFYDTYNELYPLAEGAEKRIQFYEFYLLLLHLAKFGSIYKGSVDRIMQNILSS